MPARSNGGRRRHGGAGRARSSDGDGGSLTFLWSFVGRPAGSAASLLNPTTSGAELRGRPRGTYVVQLVVNDGTADSAPDTVTISTLNSEPTANAGPGSDRPGRRLVTLDGSGSLDVGRQPADLPVDIHVAARRQHGDLVQSSGRRADVHRRSARQLRRAIDRQRRHGRQRSRHVAVSTTNIRRSRMPDPIDRGGRPNGHPRRQRSADVDGDALTFRWALTSLPAGSAAALSEPGGGDAVVRRRSAWQLRRAVDRQRRHGRQRARYGDDQHTNSAPTANAGPTGPRSVGTHVTLDGSSSLDVDGDALTFRGPSRRGPPAARRPCPIRLRSARRSRSTGPAPTPCS